MTTKTWEALADECRLMDGGEGWAFAERVACAVEKGKGGRPAKTSANAEVSRKASAEEFADRWGTSGDRVLRYLKKWDQTAPKHGLPVSTDLTPADQGTLAYDEVFPKWVHNQMGLGSINPNDTSKGSQKLADIKTNPGAVAKALADPEFAKKVSSRTDAKTKQRAIVDALENDPDVFGSKKVVHAAALAVKASFPPPPERTPSKYTKTEGDVAVSLGIQFAGALSNAVRYNKLSAQNASEIDEIVAGILDTLKGVKV